MELVPSEYRHNLKVINELLQNNTTDKVLISNINDLILLIKTISKYHTFLVYLYYLKARITKENIYFIAARDIYVENYYYLDNILAQELDWNTFNYTIMIYILYQNHWKIRIKLNQMVDISHVQKIILNIDTKL